MSYYVHVFSARTYPKMTKKWLKNIENPELRGDVSTKPKQRLGGLSGCF